MISFLRSLPPELIVNLPVTKFILLAIFQILFLGSFENSTYFCIDCRFPNFRLFIIASLSIRTLIGQMLNIFNYICGVSSNNCIVRYVLNDN